jgi:peptidoglycan/xylan/chitin deacetylase (PgdA/CDA1 family)
LFALALAAVPAVAAQTAPKSALARPLHSEERQLPDEASERTEHGMGILGEVWRVPMERKEIALTFDDGPYPFYTPLLLHELDRSHAVATFFIVGRSAQEFPELVNDIVQSGNEIGNHTFNHYKLTRLSAADIAQQISMDGTLLEPYAGHAITLFRPPHGRYDHRVVALAYAMGYRTIFWNDSPEDTKNISPAVVVKRVLAQATPGGIVLMHNGQYKTVEALPVIIDRLRAEGYRFVTVSRLLEDGEAGSGSMKPEPAPSMAPEGDSGLR